MRSIFFQSKSPIEIYGYDEENEELEFENPMKIAPFLMDGDVKIWGRFVQVINESWCDSKRYISNNTFKL